MDSTQSIHYTPTNLYQYYTPNLRITDLQRRNCPHTESDKSRSTTYNSAAYRAEITHINVTHEGGRMRQVGAGVRMCMQDEHRITCP